MSTWCTYVLQLQPGEEQVIRIRLTNTSATPGVAREEFDTIFDQRILEADEFYTDVIPCDLSEDAKNVIRQAFAGMLWSASTANCDLRVAFRVEEDRTGRRAASPSRHTGRLLCRILLRP
jgi:hypothetical protein